MTSSTTTTNVLVLGASGDTGASIVKALCGRSHFKVSVAIRPGSKLVVDNPDITVHFIDYNSNSSIDAAFRGQNAIVSAIATFAVPVQKSIIDAAVRAGVKRFIPSEYGIDTANPIAEQLIPAVGLKRSIVAYLQEKQGQGAGNISWTAICVGAFFDWAIQNGFGGFDFNTHIAQIQGDEDAAYEATNLARIGDAVAKCLEHPFETSNQYVYVHSFRVTQGQVLQAMNAASKQEWKIESVDLNSMYEQGMASSSTTEMNLGVATAIRAVLMGYNGDAKLNDFGDRAVEWGKKLGLEDENLKEVCRSIITASEA